MRTKRATSKAETRKFYKDKSVFKTWKEESEDTLLKMFECDMKYSKIHRVLKNNEEDIAQVKEELWKNYKVLKNVYYLYASISTYPVISWNDFTTFCYKVSILNSFFVVQTN